QICTNGAIIAESLGATEVDDLKLQNTYSGREAIRDAIEVCCDPEVFASNVRRMRAAAETDVDFALNMLPFVSRFSGRTGVDLMTQVLDRFFRDGDRSRFGF